ncbi:MAG TPA: CAP domain-containing protein [Polyangiaceae bacterium]|nr:CAP domain-containing protein [Polyangiaceae bacterium]
MALASEVARRRVRGDPELDVSELVARLRTHGGPQVWPRVWSLEWTSATIDPDASFERWLDAGARGKPWRCGLSLERSGERQVAAAVAVEMLADLEPLPLEIRLGQWLRLRAHALVPARAASVVLLGPRGLPRNVPTEFADGQVRAVFSLDQPGLWRVQVLLDLATGPRPALEAWVFVDIPVTSAAGLVPAPGEDLTDPHRALASLPEVRAALLTMLNRARGSEDRLPLIRDARLDELAQAHAEAMLERARTAHDVGQGLPDARLSRAGLAVQHLGENVAHAASLARAHRALWDSPAHRGNLLDGAFAVVGLGIARADRDADPSAGVWVCELFADRVMVIAPALAPR